MCKDRIWILLTRKLSGEATLTEREELDRLVSELPEGSSTINKIAALWNSDPAHDAEFMEATYLAHLERMKQNGISINFDDSSLQDQTPEESAVRRRWFSIKNMAVALLVSVVMTTGWFLLSSKKSADKTSTADQFGEVKTRKGSRTKMKLPDGSDVWLNAGSKLNYNKDFEKGSREVYLTGEAFFNVVHDADRPFLIHTSAINIKVLGTQFNVKAYDEDVTTETSLIRGSVEVELKSDPAKKYLLKPNQKLVLSNEAIQGQVKKVAEGRGLPANLEEDPEIKELAYLKDDNKTNIESSWTRNILSFEDEVFGQVARKMERWYDVNFEFRNKRWTREYMSGSFESESLEQAMQALKFSTGFNFKIEGKKVIIL